MKKFSVCALIEKKHYIPNLMFWKKIRLLFIINYAIYLTFSERTENLISQFGPTFFEEFNFRYKKLFRKVLACSVLKPFKQYRL